MELFRSNPNESQGSAPETESRPSGMLKKFSSWLGRKAAEGKEAISQSSQEGKACLRNTKESLLKETQFINDMRKMGLMPPAMCGVVVLGTYLTAKTAGPLVIPGMPHITPEDISSLAGSFDFGHFGDSLMQAFGNLGGAADAMVINDAGPVNHEPPVPPTTESRTHVEITGDGSDSDNDHAFPKDKVEAAVVAPDNNGQNIEITQAVGNNEGSGLPEGAQFEYEKNTADILAHADNDASKFMVDGQGLGQDHDLSKFNKFDKSAVDYRQMFGDGSHDIGDVFEPSSAPAPEADPVETASQNLANQIKDDFAGKDATTFKNEVGDAFTGENAEKTGQKLENSITGKSTGESAVNNARTTGNQVGSEIASTTGPAVEVKDGVAHIGKGKGA